MPSIKSYLLFTTPFCKFCPTVKEFMSTLRLAGASVDATKEEDKAISFGVNKVPTVIFLDNLGNELNRAHTISEIRSILSDE